MSAGEKGNTRSLSPGQPLNRGLLCVFVADNGNQDKVQRETNQHAHAPLGKAKKMCIFCVVFPAASQIGKRRPKTTKQPKQRPFITRRLTHFLAYALRGIICKARMRIVKYDLSCGTQKTSGAHTQEWEKQFLLF